MGITSSKQIGNLLVVDERVLPFVHEILYNHKKHTLTAIAISPQGQGQRFIRFLEAVGEGQPPAETRLATNVNPQDAHLFLKEVQAATGRCFYTESGPNEEGTLSWRRDPSGDAKENDPAAETLRRAHRLDSE